MGLRFFLAALCLHGHDSEFTEKLEEATMKVTRKNPSDVAPPIGASPVRRDRFLEIWSQFHGGKPPATTMAYVTALAQPTLKVEVEAWAARW
jgi:enamine deaminase RidA (YjgF/YER057c/UK114 family)